MDRFGRRLADTERVAADDRRHAVGETEFAEQGARQMLGLVRDDRGAHAQRVELVERGDHTGEGAAVDRDMRFVEIEQFGIEPIDRAIGYAARGTQTFLKHMLCAAPDHRPHDHR